MTRARFAAIVLAGDRGPDDPVARATGASCKALSPVAGTPLLARVLAALRASGRFQRVLVAGPAAAILQREPALAALFESYGATWLAPGDSPVASAGEAFAALPGEQPALVTTADHALLAPAMIEAMLDAPPADLGVGLIEHARVARAYPGNRRTAIRLGRGAGYCGCNLFVVATPAGRRLVADWRRVERRRKHPLRMIAGMLGPVAIGRYLLRRLSLDAAFARLSARSGVAVRPVLLDQPEAAVDVDSLADLRLVESILTARCA